MDYLFLFLAFAVIALSIPLLIVLSVVGIMKFEISNPQKKNIKAIFMLSIPLALSAVVAVYGGEQILNGTVSIYSKGSNVATIYTLVDHPFQFAAVSIIYIAVFISGLHLAFKIYRAMFTCEIK